MDPIEEILKDLVATYNDPKAAGDFDKVLSYFPELKNYNKNDLLDYVATANDPKAAGDWNKINSHFPELFSSTSPTPRESDISKQPAQTTEEIKPQAPPKKEMLLSIGGKQATDFPFQIGGEKKSLADVANANYEQYASNPENIFKAQFENFKENPELYRTGNEDFSKQRLTSTSNQYLETKRTPKARNEPSGFVPYYANYANPMGGDIPKEESDAMRDFLTNTEVGRNYAEQEKAALKELDDNINALKEKIADDEKNKPKVTRSIFTPGSPTIGQPGTWKDVEVPENYKDIEAAKSQLLRLENLQKAVNDGDKNALSQFWNEFGRNAPESLTNIATFGLSELGQNYGAYKALQDENNTLTREAYDLSSQYQQFHAADRSFAQDLANGTLKSLEFMGQFVGAGKITKPIISATEKAIAKNLSLTLAGKAFRAAAGTTGGKAIGKLTNAATEAALRTTFMPATVSMALEENAQNPGSFLDAYAVNWRRNFYENLSEMFGEFLPKSKFWKNNPRLDKFSELAGIQGFLPELAEEQLSMFFSAAYGDMDWAEFINPRTQALTAASVGLIQFMPMSINAAGYAAGKYNNVQQKRSIRKGYENNLRNMNNLFGQEAPELINWINQTIDETKDPSTIPLIASLSQREVGLSDAQRDAIAKYSYGYMAYTGLNTAKTEQVQQAQRQASEIITQNANVKTGSIMSAKIAGQEIPVRITDGNIVVTDGVIDKSKSDEQIYFKDADGKTKPVHIDNVEEIIEDVPSETAKAQAAEMITGQTAAQQENAERETYEAGERIRFDITGEGYYNYGEIVAINPETGFYEVVVEGAPKPITVEPRFIVDESNLRGINDGVIVDYVENGEIKQGEIEGIYNPLLRQEGKVLIDGKKEVDVQMVMGEAVNRGQSENTIKTSEQTVENEGITPSGESKTSEIPERTPEIILSEAPKRKDGKVDYNALMEQSPNDYATLMEQRIGVEETKAEFINDSNNLQKEIDKRKEKLSKETDRNRKEDLRDEISDLAKRKQTIDGIIQDRYGAKEENVAEPITAEESTSSNPQSQEIAEKSFVSEYNGQPLTRVEGLGMGQSQAKGTYVSFEPFNRYETETKKANPVEVSIQNPIEFDQNKGEFAKFQQQTIESRFDDFRASDFSSINEGEIPTIENLNEKGIDRLAGFVTEELQKQGYDGIVFSGEGENEIVVFNKDNVREVQKNPSQTTSVNEGDFVQSGSLPTSKNTDQPLPALPNNTTKIENKTETKPINEKKIIKIKRIEKTKKENKKTQTSTKTERQKFLEWKEPTNLYEHTLLHLLGGGQLSRADYIHDGGKDIPSRMNRSLTKKGAKFDQFEGEYYAQYKPEQWSSGYESNTNDIYNAIQDFEKSRGNFVRIKELIEGSQSSLEEQEIEYYKGMQEAFDAEKAETQEKIQQAESEVDTNPTEAQKDDFFTQSDEQVPFQFVPSTALADQSKYDFDVKNITEANAKEMQRIKTEAQANGTFMFAPNGKKSNLNEREWLLVRTEAFKKWFGDWELANKLQMIEDLAAIVIKPHTYTREQLQQIYRDIENVKNKLDNRVVEFSHGVFGKMLRFGTNGNFAKIIPQLKEVFNNSIPIYSESEQPTEGHKQHPNLVGFHNYLGRVEFGGNDYYVRFTVQEHRETTKNKGKRNPNELHNAFVSDVEIYNKTDVSEITDPGTTGRVTKTPVFVDTKLQQFFEIAREAKNNSSKVVDENGEPMRVYHGTPKDFTAFDIGKITRTDLKHGRGFYFSSDASRATGFANNPFTPRGSVNERSPMAVFLNIRDVGDIYINKHGNTARDEYVARNPNQIKSATDNNGNFDANSDDIRFQLIGEKTSQEKNAFTPILKKKFDALIELLKKTGLAKDVIVDKDIFDRVFKATHLELSNETKSKLSIIANDLLSLKETAKRNNISLLDLVKSPGILEGTVETETKEAIKNLLHNEQYFYDNVDDIILASESNNLSDSKGIAYGLVTPDGTVYLDPSKMNANTPIHEFGHLWNKFIKENNFELWNKGVELIKQSEYWKKVNENEAYKNLSEERKIDEALAWAIGDKGESQFHTNKDILFFARLKTWLNDVWNKIKEMLSISHKLDIENMTLNDFTNKAVKDLTGGKRLQNTKENSNFVENKEADNEIPNRSPQEEQRGGNEILIRNTKDELQSRIRAAEEEQQGLSKQDINDLERWEAFDYAKENGLWIDDLYSLGKPFEGGGNENTLAFDESTGTIFKSNNLANSEYSVSKLLESIETHNELFPETAYELVGFTGIAPNDIHSIQQTPYIEVLIKQKYVPNAEKATPEEITKYMESIGFEEIGGYSYTNGEYTVSDLRPRNVLKVIDSNGNKKIAVIDNIIRRNQAESDISFQVVPNEQNAGETTEEYRQKLDNKIKNLAFRLREAYEDRHLAVKNFLDVLRKAGTEIKDYNDFYLQATQIQGKNDAQLKQYNERYQKPLTNAINDIINSTNYSYRDVENYAILKHGLERNEYMREKAINEYKEKNPDATQEQLDKFIEGLPEDYSGVLTVQDEVGMNAQEYIDNFEQTVGKDKVDELWKRTNAATEFSLKKQLESGLIDKKLFDELTNRWQHYIPLRGHDAETAEDRWDYSPDTGTYFVNPIMKAKGRRSRAETPFAYILQTAQSAINSANKNTLKQTMLRLARQDKTGLLSANKTWYIKSGLDQDGKKLYEVQEPAYSEDSETYRKNIEVFEEKMQQLASEGLAVQKGGKLDIGGMFIKPRQKNQHAISVFQNGVEYNVYVNANPSVSRAINEQNVIPNDFKNIAKLTRGMAQMFTSKNPLFWMTNFARDYHYSTFTLLAREDAKYALRFQGNLPKSAAALMRHLTGNADVSNKNDMYLAEYIMNGAKTGFSHIVELNKIQKQVERDIEKGNKKNMFRHALEVVENVNDLIENMTRFSAYITSRNAGRSVIQSVSDAKELTVNFNRSGAGRYGAQFVRPLYLFVNAGIQGMSNFSRAYKKHPGKMTALVLFNSFTGSILCPMLASLMGGDDEYWKLSDYDRQNYFCIYTGKGFIKIPLSQELRVFHGFGDNMAQAFLGKKGVGYAFLDALGNFADLIPADPFGAATASLSDYTKQGLAGGLKTLGSTFSPDAIKPLTQLAANRNFMGGKIYKENQKSYRPGYTKVRTNKKGEAFAPMWLVELAKATDNFTGGDGVEGGLISIQPDIINHLVRGYAGGVYDLFSNGVDMIYKKTQGKDIEIRDTPLKRFYTSTADTEKINQGLNAKYYNIANEVKETLSKVKDYEDAARKEIDDYYDKMKNGKIGVLEYNEKQREINERLDKKLEKLDFKKYDELNEDYIKEIKELEELLPEAEGEEQKAIENDIISLKEQVIELSKKKKE